MVAIGAMRSTLVSIGRPAALVLLLAVLLAPPSARATVSGGDILAEAKGGKLVVTGDGFENDYAIDQVGLPTTSLRVAPIGGTMLNGGAAALVFPDVNGIKITDPGGGDEIQIANATLAKDVVLKLSDGDDAVQIANVDLGGKLKADMGAGANAIEITNGSTIEKKTEVKGGTDPTAYRSPTRARSARASSSPSATISSSATAAAPCRRRSPRRPATATTRCSSTPARSVRAPPS